MGIATGKPKSGRPPKTTAELKAEGGYRECRHGRRLDNGRVAAGAPQPPKDLRQDQRKLWRQIVNELPKALLSRLDETLLLELVTCKAALDELRPFLIEAPDDQKIRVSYVALQNQLLRLAADFGMSPSARARLHVPDDPDEESPMAALLDRMGSVN